MSVIVQFGTHAAIRFSEVDGSLVPVSVTADGGLSAEALHAIPLGRLTAWANATPRPDEVVTYIDPAGSWGVRRPSAKIKVPEGRRRPDSFYQRVDEVALALRAAGSLHPALEIAEANDVPVTTVHRWLKEARRRGVSA